MVKKLMRLLLPIMGSLALWQLILQEGYSFQLPRDATLIMRLKNLKEGRIPFVSHNLLFFTYEGGAQTKSVAISFEAEGFTKLRMLQRNTFNVFIYAIPMPTEKRVAYRYRVDGLWQKDPANPNYYLDNYEVAISLFAIDNFGSTQGNNPVVSDNNYDFYAYFAPGQHVYILGNFNNWNPFTSLLAEIEPGKYHISLQNLLPGVYQYYFWVDGLKHLDDRNYRVASNDQGERVSLFTVDAPP